jgi:acetolactate synthase-1/2/3 large subunit
MFALGELATIAQEQLPVTVLVVNDGGYGMLRYDPRHTGEAQAGADLLVPDFVQLASAFGIAATRVAGVGGPLEQALGEALGSGAPRMVVCDASLFPPKTTSPRWGEPN